MNIPDYSLNSLGLGKGTPLFALRWHDVSFTRGLLREGLTMGLKKHAENSSFLMLVNRIRRFVKHRTYNEYIWSYIFLAPAMAAFVVFLVYPAINTIIFSFQNFSIFQFGTSFCGS